MVILDTSTRWNSTYLSIQRALTLRKRIELFCFEYRAEIEKDILSESDWGILEIVTQGLLPFYEVTKRLEGQATHGHHGAIWEALPAMLMLLEKLEDGRLAFPSTTQNPSHMAVMY